MEWLLQQAQPAMDQLSPSKFLESEPCRKHKENEAERVERRAKARERARERHVQKLNINMELHDSTATMHLFLK